MIAASLTPGAWITPAEVERLVAVGWLLAARLAPLVVLVPAFGVRGAPEVWLATLTTALVIVLMPVAAASAPVLPRDVFLLTLLSARELCLGAVFALALALPFWALEWGGLVTDRLRTATATGPDRTFGDLYLWIGVAAFLALGGHRLVIAALADGLGSYPLGAPLAAGNVAGLALPIARLLADAFVAASMIAAPIAAVVVVADTLAGVVARTAPAWPAAVMASPLRNVLALAVALLGSAILVGRLPEAFSQALLHARRVFGVGP